jgi:GntR family hexuronate regulon transcriptional repressor
MALRAYTDVSQELLRRIDEGEYELGTRLPAERQLAEALSTSRSTLREALAALELAGVIETHAGAGSYVAARPGAADQLPADASPADVVEARLLIEPVLARAAAQSRDRHALAAIARPVRALERLADAGDPTHPGEADRRFHIAIAKSTGSAALQTLVAPLWQLMDQALWHRMKDRDWQASRTRRIAQEHRAIYEAIRARDPELAAFEMERHLRGVKAFISEGAE